jgi:hypothetical protein
MPRLPLFTLFDEPVRISWQWPPGRIQYGQEMRRPCGCYLDPVVFGHWHPGTAGAP